MQLQLVVAFVVVAVVVVAVLGVGFWPTQCARHDSVSSHRSKYHRFSYTTHTCRSLGRWDLRWRR